MAPIEKRIPNANPCLSRGVTSVWNAVFGGTPRKKKNPNPTSTKRREIWSRGALSRKRRGVDTAVDKIMKGTRKFYKMGAYLKGVNCVKLQKFAMKTLNLEVAKNESDRKTKHSAQHCSH